MMRFRPPAEPPDFDKRVRQRGKEWLRTHANPQHDPIDLWSPFKAILADGFAELCAYTVMYEPVGTVDHFLSRKFHRHLAYEWSNYRYSSQWINSSKQAEDARVLDPFEIQDAWFEILLPSLQMVLTPAVPARRRKKAEYTLQRLHLQDDERVLRQRRSWYAQYQARELTLAGLARRAPLIARAVRTERLLSQLVTEGNLTRLQIAPLCELSPRETSPFLRCLIRQGKIRRQGTAAAPFVLAPSVP